MRYLSLFFSQSRDIEETQYFVCKVCGYVADGGLPEKFPICGAKKEQFVKYL